MNSAPAAAAAAADEGSGKWWQPYGGEGGRR